MDQNIQERDWLDRFIHGRYKARCVGMAKFEKIKHIEQDIEDDEPIQANAEYFKFCKT